MYMSGKDTRDFVLRIVGCPNFLEFSHSLVDFAWIRSQVWRDSIFRMIERSSKSWREFAGEIVNIFSSGEEKRES